jgi:rhomboid protease GluP
MELKPGLKKFLEAIGVNTTRLQWKLYEWEKKRAEPEKKSRVPTGLRWLQYSHKFCPKCNSLASREDKTCASCGATLPSMPVYRLMRAIGLIFPQGQSVISAVFLVAIFTFYVVSILQQGPSAIVHPSNETLSRFGSLDWAFVRYQSQYWRLFSSGLFHYGLIHIGFNAYALMQVGPMIEDRIGARRMLALITFAELTSSLAVLQFSQYGAVGASGWIFGLIGFGVTFYHRSGPSERWIRNHYLQWALYGIVFGLLVPGISNAGHLGGLAGGALLGLTADITMARRTIWTRAWAWLFWPSIAVWGATLVFMIRSIVR